jgi:hypothetical protein
VGRKIAHRITGSNLQEEEEEEVSQRNLIYYVASFFNRKLKTIFLLTKGIRSKIF